MQNFYNVAQRSDDAIIDALAQQGIAYVPFFRWEGFTPLQSSVLDRIAGSLQVIHFAGARPFGEAQHPENPDVVLAGT